MGTVYIARHGESKANVEHRLAYPDSPLTKKGIAQAKKLAEFLADKKISVIYTTPYKRALETAKIINKKLGVKIYLVKEFVDTDFGILNGRKIDSSDKELYSYLLIRRKNPLDYKIPKAENLTDVMKRVIPALKKIMRQNPHDSVLIVAHRDVNRVIVQTLGKIPKEKVLEIEDPHDCVYIFDKNKLIYYLKGKEAEGYLKVKPNSI
jgi:probable phosphoglycerate mutase